MIRIEQAFCQQFVNLAISLCCATYRSRDTMEEAQTKYECISLSFGGRKGSLVYDRQMIVAQCVRIRFKIRYFTEPGSLKIRLRAGAESKVLTASPVK